MRLITVLLCLCFVVIKPSIGQETDKYGGNKDLCIRNISLYKGYLKNKDYSDALLFWQKMIKICPAYSSGIWADGEKIFKAVIETEKDPIRKVNLIDSLLWTYDQRINYFGDHPRFTNGYILGKKGLALINYEVQPSTRGYEALKKSVEMEGEKSYPAIILALMKVSKSLFQSGLIDASEIINNYSICINIVDENLIKTPDNKDYITAKNGIEKHLINSQAADCTTLVDLFTKQFSDLQDDSKWLLKVTRLLKSTGCDDTEFYQRSVEALFVLEPSGESAHKIANMYFMQGDYEKAIHYLTIGVAVGENLEQKASMYYELAYIHFTQLKNYQNARIFARKASELRPNWGDPYILIGKMYIDDRKSVSSQVFEQDAVFWAAVDKFIEAKKVDPEQNQRANELIQQYSQYFPINEDVFMWTLKDGKSYKVGGWINETTTVRSRRQN